MTAATGLTLTEKAVQKLRSLLQAEGKSPERHGLRVGVKAGGCSGLSYVLDIDMPKPNDNVFETEGIKLFVDPKSIMFLRGSVVDYVESLMGAGFKIRNPLEKSRCGCGESFAT